MDPHSLDPYQRGDSLVHQLDPRVKLILAFGFILTGTLTPVGDWWMYALLLGLVWAGAILAELGVGYLLKRAFLAIPFVLAALPLILTVREGAQIPFTVAFIHGSISLTGLLRFASIALKSWIAVQAAILLTATTPFPDLLMSLRAIRVPRLLVAIIGLMWRYLFVLIDEAGRLLQARELRSSQTDDPRLKVGGNLGWRAHVAGGMAGSLFLRSYERSDRIYMAMIARGYDGEPRALSLPHLGTPQKVTLATGILVFFLLLLLAAGV